LLISRSDTGFFGFLHWSDAGVRAGIVDDDSRCAARDGCVKQLVLFVGVVIMDKDKSFVPEFLGLCFSAYCLRLKKGVVMGGRDNYHELAGKRH
jgi:hypothetical protein